MKLPFTTEQFLDIFKEYNLNVFPVHILFYVFAATVILFSFRGSANSDRVNVLILSFLFMWVGIVYHILHFTAINKAAYLFGTVFIIQSLLFLFYGIMKRRLVFRIRP